VIQKTTVDGLIRPSSGLESVR